MPSSITQTPRCPIGPTQADSYSVSILTFPFFYSISSSFQWQDQSCTKCNHICQCCLHMEDRLWVRKASCGLESVLFPNSYSVLLFVACAFHCSCTPVLVISEWIVGNHREAWEEGSIGTSNFAAQIFVIPLLFKHGSTRGCRDDSVVRSTRCSFRGEPDLVPSTHMTAHNCL